MENINRLMDEVRRLYDTSENLRKEAALKAVKSGARSDDVGIPLICSNDMEFVCRALNFSLTDYYTDPLAFIEYQLRMMLWHHENIPDDMPVSKSVFIRFGVALVPSLFGVKCEFPRDRTPLYRQDGRITELRHLDAILPLDFRKSGLMPRVHYFYETLREVLPPDFGVEFAAWDAAPLGTACMVMDHSGFLVDMMVDPEKAAAMLDMFTQTEIDWYRERARFLRTDLTEISLGDDAVESPTLSPTLYRGLVLDREMKVKEEVGAIGYWHSCGNTTPFFEDISQLEPQLMDVSAWSDVEAADQVFPISTSFECCLDGIKILAGDHGSELSRSRRIHNTRSDRMKYVCVNGLSPRTTPKADLEALCHFIQAYRELSD